MKIFKHTFLWPMFFLSLQPTSVFGSERDLANGGASSSTTSTPVGIVSSCREYYDARLTATGDLCARVWPTCGNNCAATTRGVAAGDATRSTPAGGTVRIGN